MTTRTEVQDLLAEHDGLLQLDPAFVARSWMVPGRRLGLTEEQYDAGERGWICERWLASTTPAGNAVTVEGEGISLVRSGERRIRLDELVEAAPDLVLGAEYARSHGGLGRLAKIFDYGERVPFHIHPPTEQARKVGLQSKDEAYYYLPGVDLGPHPESFFGLHASLSPEEASERLVEHLRAWDDDHVVGLSRGYRLFPEGGYFVPSGVLHAPGTALTLELQEDSDAMAFLQAVCGEVHLSKELLLGNLSLAARAERGEAAVLDWVDWDLNLMPDFHSAYHLDPRTIPAAEEGVDEAWLFWGGGKFAAKRMRMRPGASATRREPGAFSLFVWRGSVRIGGIELHGGRPGSDELLVTADRAARGIDLVALGDEPVELISFFGPGLTPDAPRIDRKETRA